MSLNHVQLEDTGAHAVAQLHRHLTHIHLCSTELTVSGMSQLFMMPWPYLQVLFLRDNTLGADAIAVLALACLPSLAILDLARNKLDAALQLVRGSFPCLHDLCLNHNNFNNASMTVLAKGCWPALLQLSLADNYINARGVERLMQGNWPELCALALDKKAVSSATWGHLDLALNELPNMGEVPQYLAVDRSAVLPLQPVIWPKLVRVAFGSGMAN